MFANATEHNMAEISLTGPRWSEIADFQSIFARSAATETPSEKSSINTNRKSTTRFPMRWSSYVAWASKGAQKRKTAVFGVNHTSLEESLPHSFFVW